MTSSQKRIFLWAVPRSLSSAMCRVMMNSGLKTQIVFEQYSGAYYFGPDRVSDRFSHLPPDPRYSYENIKNAFELPYEDKDLVFAKDFPFCLEPSRVTSQWMPQGYTHTFLTRHPRSTVASYYRAIDKIGWAVLNPKELGYKQQLDLIRVLQEQGDRIILMDSQDILNDPEGMVRAYCQAVGLEFQDSMIHWDPISEKDYQIFTQFWEDEWFEDLKAKNQLQRKPPNGVSIEALFGKYDPKTREDAERMVQENLAYYQEMHDMRLVV